MTTPLADPATAARAGTRLSVLLVNPPSPPGLSSNREGAGGFGAWSSGDKGFIYPPQSLALAAAVLRNQGRDVSLVDACGERLDTATAIRRVQERPASIIAVLVAHISLDNDIAFLNSLSVGDKSRLLAVGSGAAFVEPQLLERTDVDHVLIGEPEAMLPGACGMLAGENSARRLHRKVTAADLGLLGMDAAGRSQDLDDLPFPAWDLVPLQGYGFVTMLTSRGCDDTCAFCPYAVGMGRRLRIRSTQRVLEEMAWLATTIRPKRLILRDPVFARERNRVELICQGIIDRKLPLAWECESRPEHFDRDLLRLMQRAGCKTVKIGLETTSASVLRELRRVSSDAEAYLRHTTDLVEVCRELDIGCRVFTMTGLPGQTDADVADTVAYLRQLRPSGISVKPFHRYPGLPMPPGDAAEERERGIRQARFMENELASLRPSAAPSLLHRLRRWLERRMR
jgi:anaerobic magnesium-protoporphyrin IX monomethyl ester cyclase